MLERLNEEIKLRTRVVRIFPNADRCLQLIRALAVETHEGWLEEHRHLNMDLTWISFSNTSANYCGKGRRRAKEKTSWKDHRHSVILLLDTLTNTTQRAKQQVRGVEPIPLH